MDVLFVSCWFSSLVTDCVMNMLAVDDRTSAIPAAAKARVFWKRLKGNISENRCVFARASKRTNKGRLCNNRRRRCAASQPRLFPNLLRFYSDIKHLHAFKRLLWRIEAPPCGFSIHPPFWVTADSGIKTTLQTVYGRNQKSFKQMILKNWFEKVFHLHKKNPSPGRLPAVSHFSTNTQLFIASPCPGMFQLKPRLLLHRFSAVFR